MEANRSKVCNDAVVCCVQSISCSFIHLLTNKYWLSTCSALWWHGGNRTAHIPAFVKVIFFNFSSLESCLSHVHIRRGSVLHIWMVKWPHSHSHGPATCVAPWGPMLRRGVCLNALLVSFWIPHDFMNNGPAFSFCTGLYKLCSWSWLVL